MKALQNGKLDFISIIVNLCFEIVLSILFARFSSVFSISEKYFKSNSKRQALAVTFVILAVALSKIQINIGAVEIGFSPLLVCMMLGTIFCNICDFSADLMEKTDKWTTPLFILFFVISGSELELSVFSDIAIVGIGVIYIIFRSLGKYYGARWSSKLMKCDRNIIKYLGFTLLPQAGVALGMSITAKSGLGTEGIIRTSCFSELDDLSDRLTKASHKAGDISEIKADDQQTMRMMKKNIYNPFRLPICKAKNSKRQSIFIAPAIFFVIILASDTLISAAKRILSNRRK